MSGAVARLQATAVADQLAGLGAVRVARFFGGFALRLDGVQFAFVMKGTLYLRVDGTMREAFEEAGALPFSYAGRSGRVQVASYHEMPGELIDDAETLMAWAARAHRVALAERARRTKGSLSREAGAVPPHRSARGRRAVRRGARAGDLGRG